MKSLIQQLPHGPEGSTGTILVVGAGSGTELPALRALGSQRLILAEAHPRHAEDLARHLDATRGEEVWPLAITGTPSQQATLHILNNTRHSSLKPPTALDQHYPNLRVTGKIQVPARSLGESIQSLGPETKGHFLLIIDAPGQAAELLNATPASLLQSFAWIIVRCGAEPLYAGARGASDTLAALKEIGFEIASENAEALYPQTEVLVKRDDTRIHIRHLEAQIKQLDEGRAAQLQVASDREAQIKILTQERDEQSKLLAQVKAELGEANQAAAEQQKLVADRQTQIQALVREHDEQLKLTNSYKDKEIEAKFQENEALRDELATARQTASVSVRLQALREADLKDLQRRYQSLYEKFQVQHQLLKQLNEKLSSASNYFHILAADDRTNSLMKGLQHRLKQSDDVVDVEKEKTPDV